MQLAAGEIETQARAEPAQIGRVAIEAVLGAVLLALWAAAFVGLRASSYWVDELWTLFVAGHGGVGEVFRRALADNHPPAYYLIVHFWIRLWGDGEAATRSFSACCAVGASALFVGATGAAFSRPARLFAAAAGASSIYWFFQSQNVRSYGLAMLILVALLGCALQAKRQSAAGARVGAGLCLGVALFGLLGGLVHYYLLVAVGLVYFGLLVTVPDLRLRLTVLVAGSLTLAVAVSYILVQRADTQVGYAGQWFTNDPKVLTQALQSALRISLGHWAKRACAVLAAALAYGLWTRRRGGGAAPGAAKPLADWIAGLSLFVAVGLAAAGLAVSLLFEPSFSDRNLLICEPCLWILVAWLYDRAVGPAPSRAGLVFAGLASAMIALELTGLPGRLLQRNEDWRGSAQYVDGLAACRGRDIPVVLPSKFGPDTPFFRRLAERDFFGRYYRGGGRLVVVSERELASSPAPGLSGLLRARTSGADPCPVLAWAVHDMEDATAAALATAISLRPDVRRPVLVHRIASFNRDGERWRLDWPAAYIFERPPGGTGPAPPAAPLGASR